MYSEIWSAAWGFHDMLSLMLFTWPTPIKCHCFWDVTSPIVMYLSLTKLCGVVLVNVLFPGCRTWLQFFSISFEVKYLYGPVFFFSNYSILGLGRYLVHRGFYALNTFLNTTERRPLSTEGAVLSPSMIPCVNAWILNSAGMISWTSCMLQMVYHVHTHSKKTKKKQDWCLWAQMHWEQSESQLLAHHWCPHTSILEKLASSVGGGQIYCWNNMPKAEDKHIKQIPNAWYQELIWSV